MKVPGQPGPRQPMTAQAVRIAVALRYQTGSESAPRVLAKGRNEMAERIIELAEEHGITRWEDAELAALLAAVDVNREIPPTLYQALAQVLAHLYRAEAAARGPKA